MTLKQAINKAIKGGWNHTKKTKYDKKVDYNYDSFKSYKGFWLIINTDKMTRIEEKGEYKKVPITISMAMEKVLLDPEFWKALGKALDKERTDGMIPNQANWKEKWHALIDHLADGGSIEEYFKQL